MTDDAVEAALEWARTVLVEPPDVDAAWRLMDRALREQLIEAWIWHFPPRQAELAKRSPEDRAAFVDALTAEIPHLPRRPDRPSRDWHSPRSRLVKYFRWLQRGLELERPVAVSRRPESVVVTWARRGQGALDRVRVTLRRDEAGVWRVAELSPEVDLG